MSIRNAYFAGGCFWCITPIFKIYGASSVISGYSGGDEENPTYEDVKHQRTGHREAIAVEYDDEKVSYSTLLELYLANIDPFDAGGQFIDRGHSYTLAIFYTDANEEILAKKAIKELEETERKKVQISVEPFKSFYPAEEYHQDYYLKNPEAFEKELIESGRKKGDS